MSVNFREEDPTPSKEVDDLFFLASYCALVTTRDISERTLVSVTNTPLLQPFSESFG